MSGRGTAITVNLGLDPTSLPHFSAKMPLVLSVTAHAASGLAIRVALGQAPARELLACSMTRAAGRVLADSLVK